MKSCWSVAGRLQISRRVCQPATSSARARYSTVSLSFPCSEFRGTSCCWRFVEVSATVTTSFIVQDMLNHTVPSHSDHKLLEEALVTIKAVANEINEAIKDQEKRKNLLAIQRRIGQQLPFNVLTLREVSDPLCQLVEPHRSFVREGELWKVCRKTKKRRYFFLFTDLLLYGEETSTGFKHHLHIGMQTLHVSDLPDSDGLKNSFAVCSWTEQPPVYAYSLPLKIESSRKSFVVIADAPEGKSGWLTDISKRIEEFIINKNSFHTNRTGTATPTFQAPVWQTDGEVVKCNICSDEFSLINRRVRFASLVLSHNIILQHHCRLCGSWSLTSRTANACCRSGGVPHVLLATDLYRRTTREAARVCSLLLPATRSSGGNTLVALATVSISDHSNPLHHHPHQRNQKSWRWLRLTLRQHHRSQLCSNFATHPESQQWVQAPSLLRTKLQSPRFTLQQQSRRQRRGHHPIEQLRHRLSSARRRAARPLVLRMTARTRLCLRSHRRGTRARTRPRTARHHRQFHGTASRVAPRLRRWTRRGEGRRRRDLRGPRRCRARPRRHRQCQQNWASSRARPSRQVRPPACVQTSITREYFFC
eukprot:TRINITY_DN1879_c0_g1_i1.p1 TRINITY_DN1879_c0_g1~~TRINITY_DN1879_c0_g1_i1.p1  ORF type:complete len:591 (-),score=28.83 TRINITY_DN1879_c0_g1_i1:39-1811(-)